MKILFYIHMKKRLKFLFDELQFIKQNKFAEKSKENLEEKIRNKQNEINILN